MVSGVQISGAAEVQACGQGCAKVIELLAKYGPRFERYIRMQSKLSKPQLQRAINTARYTLNDHEQRLQGHVKNAVTQWDWNRINSFKRETELLRMQLQVMEETLPSKH